MPVPAGAFFSAIVRLSPGNTWKRKTAGLDFTVHMPQCAQHACMCDDNHDAYALCAHT